MGMRKYQSVEGAEIVNQEDHDRIASSLKKLGKKSVQELSDSEKARFAQSLQDSE